MLGKRKRQCSVVAARGESGLQEIDFHHSDNILDDFEEEMRAETMMGP